jgi:hypothetical protein
MREVKEIVDVPVLSPEWSQARVWIRQTDRFLRRQLFRVGVAWFIDKDVAMQRFYKMPTASTHCLRPTRISQGRPAIAINYVCVREVER